MFNKLKDLIFGLGEFEKTKIEIRFELASSLIDNLTLKKLEDLELIEECLYKIKDLLRLKSSNLNKTINNPSIILKRKDVFQIIDKLNKIKYDFLNSAFEKFNSDDLNIKTEKDKIENQKLEDIDFSEDSKINEINLKKQNLLNKLDNLFENKVDIENNDKNNIQENSNIFFENDDFILYFENSKILYFLIKFKEKTNFIILKDLSSILFDLIKAHGTNIIIEENYTLILPRFNQDNLFKLPQYNSNLEEVFNLLKNNLNNNIGDKNINNNSSNSNNNFKDDNKKIENIKNLNDDIKNDSFEDKKEDYIQIEDKKSKTKESLKKKEDSLDNLLEKQLHNIEHTIKEKVNENDKIEIEKNDDKVFLEFNEEDKIINPEIEIEKKDEIKNIEDTNYLIYSDESIEVFLDDNFDVLGQINIKSKKSDSFSNLSENDLSYLMIFSKIFSSVLFDTIKIDGTNLIYDMNSNIMRIIPRVEKDEFNNLTWKSLTHSDDFLEQLKNKLLLGMQNELEENSNIDSNEEKTKIDSKDNFKEKNKESSSLKEKANYILDSLKRIP